MLTLAHEAGYHIAGQACYLCLRVEDVIDTGVQIEGEGVLAICTNCVKEMAVEGGMDPEAEVEVEMMAVLTGQLTEERDAAKKMSKRLRTELRESKEALAAIAERLSEAEVVANRVIDLEIKLRAYEADFGA